MTLPIRHKNSNGYRFLSRYHGGEKEVADHFKALKERTVNTVNISLRMKVKYRYPPMKEN